MSTSTSDAIELGGMGVPCVGSVVKSLAIGNPLLVSSHVTGDGFGYVLSSPVSGLVNDAGLGNG